MRLRWIAAAFSIFLLTNADAQKLMGIVVEKTPQGETQPLPGANVYWQGTTKGTTSRDNGVFIIDRIPGNDKLIVSFVGYTADTLTITNETNVKVELRSDQVLNEVVVEGWKSTSSLDQSSNINVIVMNEKELFKAACCNLSESFETNPSVDVAFTDAVTGTRQIQMLGLSGPNTMISVENIPGVRGLAASQGIQFIPGTWINSIQVTKGVGSVINGYESIAGQINVELKKPQESDKVYLNGYVNNSARSELNAIWTGHTGKKWATTVLMHGSIRPTEMDQNNDSFLDFPTGTQLNFINRWVYNSGNWLGQFSFKVLTDDKQGGQTGYNPDVDKNTMNRYGLEINTDRYEFTGKLAYQFPMHPYKSVAIQVNGLTHKQDSYFGVNTYDAREKSVYTNLIYQSIIGSTIHKFKTGLSFIYDQQEEYLEMHFRTTPNFDTFNFNRTELVPGAFVEYNYDDLKKFSVIAGARVDKHNMFGWFFVPRLHLKYDFTNTTSLRVSGGRGIRVANFIAENSNFLVSSRRLYFQNQTAPGKAYGYRPDDAWNAGVNLSQDFELDYRPGTISVDYFYTTFKNQIVLDYDAYRLGVNVVGLQGKSYSHSFQAQVDYQLIRRFDVRLAYRRLNVETDYLEGRLARPLIPKDRSFVNLSYRTKSNWSFDYTVQRIGSQRIPKSNLTPTEFQLPAYSDPYWMMSAQITKDFIPKKLSDGSWSVYLGIENLTNFRLDNPIVSASDPFGPYFDSSMVWGPVFGRMFYGGFRYRIK